LAYPFQLLQKQCTSVEDFGINISVDSVKIITQH